LPSISSVVAWLSSRLLAAAPAPQLLLLGMAALVALAVLCLFLALRDFIALHAQPAGRLHAYIGVSFPEEEQKEAARRRRGGWQRAFMRLSLAGRLARELEHADLALSVLEYMLILAGATALGFVVGVLRGSVPLGLVLAICAPFAVRVWVSRRTRKRRQLFARQLNDIINLVVGALRVGYGTLQALSIVAQEMPPPASQEMGRVVREVQLGLPLAAALTRSAERMDNDDWSLIVTSVKIQAEVGGNLAEILQNVGTTIRERERILGEIRVLTTQQRLTGWLLSLLPVGLAVALFIINPEYMSGLFTPGLPLMLAMLGGLGIVAGAIVIRRIVSIEV